MSDAHLRLSDAERERAGAELGEHYAQGRLTAEEHAERLDQVWATRTRGELPPIFADLPGPHRPVAPRAGTPPGAGYWSSGSGPWRRGRPGPPTPLVVVLAVLVLLTVATHLPLILAGLLVWLFIVVRHRRHGWNHGWSGPGR